MAQCARRAPRARDRLARGGWVSGLLRSRFVAYGAAGSVAAATHLAVLVGLTEVVGLTEWLASGIGFCCATPVNYLLQHRYVFSSKARHLTAFSRYLAVTLATLGLNVVLFHALLSTGYLHYVVVQIVVIGVLFVVNFLINRSYTFAATRA